MMGRCLLKTYQKAIVFVGVTLALLGVQGAFAGNQFIYFGAAPTYSSTNFDWTNADTSTDTNPADNGRPVINQASGNTQVGLFIGYGVLIEKIYFGVEGSTQFGQRTATSTTQDYNNQVPLNNTATMKDIYIVDFRPGYVVGSKNSMIYGIIGLNTANFSAEQQTNNEVIVQDSGTFRRDGLRLGLGYSLGLGEHFMARVEYAYTQFGSFQFTDSFPNNTEIHTWEVDPSSNEFNLGLSVIFNI